MPVNGNAPITPFQDGAIGAPNEEKPADVRAICDEQPGEVPTAMSKKPNITTFVTKVTARLRTVVPIHLRVHTRRALFELLSSVNLGDTQQPYDPAAADRLRESLVTAGVGEAFVLDLKMVLEGFEFRAQERKAQVELVAEKLEAERRRQEEWEVMEQTDVEEEWELV